VTALSSFPIGIAPVQQNPKLDPWSPPQSPVTESPSSPTALPPSALCGLNWPPTATEPNRGPWEAVALALDCCATSRAFKPGAPLSLGHSTPCLPVPLGKLLRRASILCSTPVARLSYRLRPAIVQPACSSSSTSPACPSLALAPLRTRPAARSGGCLGGVPHRCRAAICHDQRLAQFNSWWAALYVVSLPSIFM
jgi:hypothetical protein